MIMYSGQLETNLTVFIWIIVISKFFTSIKNLQCLLLEIILRIVIS